MQARGTQIGSTNLVNRPNSSAYSYCTTPLTTFFIGAVIRGFVYEYPYLVICHLPHETSPEPHVHTHGGMYMYLLYLLRTYLNDLPWLRRTGDRKLEYMLSISLPSKTRRQGTKGRPRISQSEGLGKSQLVSCMDLRQGNTCRSFNVVASRFRSFDLCYVLDPSVFDLITFLHKLLYLLPYLVTEPPIYAERLLTPYSRRHNLRLRTPS